MPLDLDKEQQIKLFLGALGRTLDFKYEKEVEIADPNGGDNFTTFRFVPMEDTFDSSELNAENECFCVTVRNFTHHFGRKKNQ